MIPILNSVSRFVFVYDVCVKSQGLTNYDNYALNALSHLDSLIYLSLYNIIYI